MTLSPAIAAVRNAVAAQILPASTGVAFSGGADSTALLAAVSFLASRGQHPVHALIIDHQLQQNSAAVAAVAASRAAQLGAQPLVLPVVVDPTSAGIEAGARKARYAALAAQAAALGLSQIFLGHTETDQAETVLLGLARGSGARAIAGMAAQTGIYYRPLLGLPRETTVAACQAAGLEYWDDPHNFDPKFSRVRVRQQLLELAELLPGIMPGLARTAKLARADADYLAQLAETAWAANQELLVTDLAKLPDALRWRVLRLATLAAGAPGSELTYQHILECDSLIMAWRGQKWIDLPGPLRMFRNAGKLVLESVPKNA